MKKILLGLAGACCAMILTAAAQAHPSCKADKVVIMKYAPYCLYDKPTPTSNGSAKIYTMGPLSSVNGQCKATCQVKQLGLAGSTHDVTCSWSVGKISTSGDVKCPKNLGR